MWGVLKRRVLGKPFGKGFWGYVGIAGWSGTLIASGQPGHRTTPLRPEGVADIEQVSRSRTDMGGMREDGGWSSTDGSDADQNHCSIGAKAPTPHAPQLRPKQIASTFG